MIDFKKKTQWIPLAIWLLFWMLSFIILHSLFTLDYNNGWIDIVFTLVFHIPLIIIVVIHHWIFKCTFLKKKYGLYILFFIFLNAIGIYLFHLLFGPISKLLLPDYYFSLYYTDLEIIQFISAYLVVSILISLSNNWYSLKNKQILLEREHHKMKMENLKAQLNPHFLFNSLNNIYSIAKENKKITSKYILQLSESLRYMIYDTDESFVLLENEINYLENYIELEKLRMEDASRIKFLVQGDYGGYVIAPLILLPVVENCFKHCDRNCPEISIHINIEHDTLIMHTSNNMDLSNHKVKKSGVGTDNLIKRLEMIYSGNYKWSQQNQDNYYLTNLMLKLGDYD